MSINIRHDDRRDDRREQHLQDERDAGDERDEHVGQVLIALVRHPLRRLFFRWNWKSAVLSSGFRAIIFFFVNLGAGLNAAAAAMLTELIFRGLTAGFYGAFTQAFSLAQPRWLAAVAVTVLLPTITHTMELGVHWLRGTEKLAESITASVIFTIISTLFNLFAMQRGAFIVGEGRSSLLHDLRATPRLIVLFVVEIVKVVGRGFKRTQRDVKRPTVEPTGEPTGEPSRV
jgi:hypothetical protein